MEVGELNVAVEAGPFKNPVVEEQTPARVETREASKSIFLMQLFPLSAT